MLFEAQDSVDLHVAGDQVTAGKYNASWYM
jgi:hypothetical protein